MILQLFLFVRILIVVLIGRLHFFLLQNLVFFRSLVRLLVHALHLFDLFLHNHSLVGLYGGCGRRGSGLGLAEDLILIIVIVIIVYLIELRLVNFVLFRVRVTFFALAVQFCFALRCVILLLLLI